MNVLAASLCSLVVFVVSSSTAFGQCYVKTGTTSCFQEWSGPYTSTFCRDYDCEGYSCVNTHSDVYNVPEYFTSVDKIQPGNPGEYLATTDTIWCWAQYECGDCAIIPFEGIKCTQELFFVSYIDDDTLWGYCQN